MEDLSFVTSLITKNIYKPILPASGAKIQDYYKLQKGAFLMVSVTNQKKERRRSYILGTYTINLHSKFHWLTRLFLLTT
jgi:hypothetical protein